MKKSKNKAAQNLVALRWKKTTPKERLDHSHKMLEALAEKRAKDKEKQKKEDVNSKENGEK